MYELIKYLVTPFPLLLLLLGVMLASLWRKRCHSRRRLLLVTVPFLALVVLCMPAVSYFALGSLEWRYPPLAERPATARAIVVLSGAVDPPNEVQPRAVLQADSLCRCLHAAELYRQAKPCLVVVSGGKVDPTQPGPTLAAAMHEFLLTQAVAAEDLLMEDRSRTTYENAVETSKLLATRGIHEVILVTDAAALYRAERCFRRQGINVIPAGCRYRATAFRGIWSDFCPSPGAAKKTEEASHEWIGLLWYWLLGRI